MRNIQKTRVRFEGSQPILRVEDMKTALRSYVDVLGFENASWGADDFTSISRDKACICLSLGAQGRGGAWLWIGVEDVEALHEELKVAQMPSHDRRYLERLRRRRPHGKRERDPPDQQAGRRILEDPFNLALHTSAVRWSALRNRVYLSNPNGFAMKRRPAGGDPAYSGFTRARSI